jgi:hypothetical protein
MNHPKLSVKVTKLFQAHGLTIRSLGRQVIVFKFKDLEKTLQVFNTVQEARTSYRIL